MTDPQIVPGHIPQTNSLFFKLFFEVLHQSGVKLEFAYRGIATNVPQMGAPNMRGWTEQSWSARAPGGEWLMLKDGYGMFEGQYALLHRKNREGEVQTLDGALATFHEVALYLRHPQKDPVSRLVSVGFASDFYRRTDPAVLSHPVSIEYGPSLSPVFRGLSAGLNDFGQARKTFTLMAEAYLKNRS